MSFRMEWKFQGARTYKGALGKRDYGRPENKETPRNEVSNQRDSVLTEILHQKSKNLTPSTKNVYMFIIYF